MRLPRIHGRRLYEPIAIGGHQRRDEQKIARLHGLRLMTEYGRDVGVDMALGRRATGLRRDHVDLDLAVVGREPMLYTRNDRYGRASLAEMPRPRLIEGRIVFAVREVDLGVHDVLQPRASQRKRGRNPLGDDEFGLELDRLPAPLRAFGHQSRRGDPATPRLIPDRERRNAWEENEVADRNRRRVAGGRAPLELLVLEVL